jgi:hypothetical protein
MPSGGKTLVINTQERAVSTDINRLQSFANANDAEVSRWAMDVLQGSDDGVSLIQNVQYLTLTSPPAAEVYGGLLVRPQLSTSPTPLGLLVDPGVAYMVAPDTDADASVYKLIVDPGVLNATTLLMTANSSGSLRVDVIECQYTLNANAETDNRDIFNPSTGLFAAVTVSKATQGYLVYRVRAGTPGGGFPGTATGWLPLAVASVPTATTTNATITFWDVRPLVRDRIVPPFNVAKALPGCSRNQLQIGPLSTLVAALTGTCDTTGSFDNVNSVYSSYRLGGYFLPVVDLNAAVNQSAGLTNGLAYVYLLAPFGLPRWQQYAPESLGTRTPYGHKGIVTITNTPPVGILNSAPTVAVTLPGGASAPLPGTTSQGICVAVAAVQSGTVIPTLNDGTWQTVSGGTSQQTAGAVSGSSITFTGNGNGLAQVAAGSFSYPGNAVALDCQFQIVASVNATSVGTMAGGPSTSFVEVTDSTGAIVYGAFLLTTQQYPNFAGGAAAWDFGFELRIPLPFSAALPIKIKCSFTLVNATLTSGALNVQSVRLP